ncbi:hypothetical protein OH77DRAFT_1198513 [Trametes cingulata]|nr:hypothetical protein OH77DRAFT_1198513 [Trametes cingulata]
MVLARGQRYSRRQKVTRLFASPTTRCSFHYLPPTSASSSRFHLPLVGRRKRCVLLFAALNSRPIALLARRRLSGTSTSSHSQLLIASRSSRLPSRCPIHARTILAQLRPRCPIRGMVHCTGPRWQDMRLSRQTCVVVAGKNFPSIWRQILPLLSPDTGQEAGPDPRTEDFLNAGAVNRSRNTRYHISCQCTLHCSHRPLFALRK